MKYKVRVGEASLEGNLEARKRGLLMAYKLPTDGWRAVEKAKRSDPPPRQGGSSVQQRRADRTRRYAPEGRRLIMPFHNI